LNEDNWEYIIIEKMKLLFYNESTNRIDELNQARRILSYIERIFSSPSYGEAFVYFLKYGAATAWILQVDLEMPEATAYRCLKKLRSLNLIERARRVRISKNTGGGPKPSVWALQGASSEQVAEAIIRHSRSLSPKYRVAEKLVQRALDRFYTIRNKNETSLQALTGEARAMNVRASERRDVAWIAMMMLKDKGVKVWG
jgi:hypothetical protein